MKIKDKSVARHCLSSLSLSYHFSFRLPQKEERIFFFDTQKDSRFFIYLFLFYKIVSLKEAGSFGHKKCLWGGKGGRCSEGTQGGRRKNPRFVQRMKRAAFPISRDESFSHYLSPRGGRRVCVPRIMYIILTPQWSAPLPVNVTVNGWELDQVWQLVCSVH